MKERKKQDTQIRCGWVWKVKKNHFCQGSKERDFSKRRKDQLTEKEEGK